MTTLDPFTCILLGTALVPAEPAPMLERQAAPAVQMLSDDELAGFETVSDKELAGHRGGFSWQGVDVTLGAEVRTFLNGDLVLQTNISWTPTGAQTSQIVSGALTPAAAAQLQAGILTSGGISMRVGDQSVFLANGGQTAILHRTDGAIQNILVNRASNITARQEVDAVLGLDNFQQFQDRLSISRLGNAIGEAVGEATVRSLGH